MNWRYFLILQFDNKKNQFFAENEIKGLRTNILTVSFFIRRRKRGLAHVPRSSWSKNYCFKFRSNIPAILYRKKIIELKNHFLPKQNIEVSNTHNFL